MAKKVKSTVPDIKTKFLRHTKNQENMNRNKDKMWDSGKRCQVIEHVAWSTPVLSMTVANSLEKVPCVFGESNS